MTDDALPCEERRSAAELENAMRRVSAGEISVGAAIQIAYAIGFDTGFDVALSKLRNGTGGIVRVGERHTPEIQS